MIDFIGGVIAWLVIIISQGIWWVLTTFYPVIIMGVVLGFPAYLLLKKRKERRYEYRLTPQSPSVYYNSFSHLIRVEPDPEMECSVRQHFRDENITEKTFRK